MKRPLINRDRIAIAFLLMGLFALTAYQSHLDNYLWHCEYLIKSERRYVNASLAHDYRRLESELAAEKKARAAEKKAIQEAFDHLELYQRNDLDLRELGKARKKAADAGYILTTVEG